MGDLTRNFSRSEFDKPETYPDALVQGHLLPLVDLAQWLSDLQGNFASFPTDTYRSPAHNASIVGASATSQHMDGDAVDVEFPFVSMREHAKRALDAINAGAAPAFGQLIFYVVKGHVHVSNPAPRLGDRNGQVLVCIGADASGKDIFNPLTDPDTQLPVFSDAQKKTSRRSSPLSSSSSSASRGSRAAKGGE